MGGVNIAGQGADLAFSSGSALTVGQEGPALLANASTSGMYAAAPASLLGINAMSIYARGTVVDSTQGNDSDLIGLTYTNTDSSPYALFAIGTPSWAAPQLNFNDGGAFNYIASAFTAVSSNNTRYSFGATYAVNGNAIAYSAGVQTASTSFGVAAPTYVNAKIELGGYYPVQTRNLGASVDIGLFYNRALTADEMAWLDREPYCFLLPAEGEMPALSAPSGTTTLYAFEETWPPSARNSTLPKLSARQDFWQFGGIKQTANPPPAPLYEYDRWEENRQKGEPVSQRATDWLFGPQIPGTPTTPSLGQYDQWVSAQKQKFSQTDFQSFVTTSAASFLRDFDQWSSPLRLRLAIAQDWPSFVFVPSTQAVTVTLQEFDQFQNKVQLFKPGPDFTTCQAINQYVTPATPKLSEFDRWSMAFAPKITQTPFNDFTFIPAAVVAQTLKEFDQWAIVQRQKLAVFEFHGFGPRIPGAPTTPYLGQFDQWVSAQRARLVSGDFQGFVTAPAATILNEFDQWSASQRHRLVQGDFTGFERVSAGTPTPSTLGEFDQWAVSTRQKLVSGDFTSFTFTPLAQLAGDFDGWWEKAKTPLVVSAKQDWAGFVFNPPAVAAQPLRQFDQWQPNWNKGVPVSQRTQFWDFARIDQPPVVAQSLKQFDSWSPPRTTTQVGKDFTSFVGTPPTTATTTAFDVWVKKKRKPLPPVIIDRPRKRKPEPEEFFDEDLPDLPFPEPPVSPHTLIPLPPATLPAHIFKAPQWALPQLSTSPPPLPTQEEIDAEDARIMAMLANEDQGHMDDFGELMDLIKDMRNQ